MLVNSSTNALPAKYRLGLAISLALFLHTLLLSGIPTPLDQQAETHRESVRFELISPGSRETSATLAEKLNQQSSQIPTFDAPSLTEESRPAPEFSTTRQLQAPTPTKVTTDSPPRSESAKASTGASVGEKVKQVYDAKDMSIARITRSPAELDPYAVRLALHLAAQIEKLRVPAMGSLTETVAMEVELQLLGNGALTRARVLKSTGIENLDEAAYRAALAASPYPQPPEAAATGNRFEVELLFTPKRL